MSNHSTEFTDPAAMLGYSPKTPAFHTHKVSSSGTLDLWRDGLLCAYEYVPAAPKRKFKVGADFGNQNGDVQGRLDCKISVQPPYDVTGVDSEDLPAGEGEGEGEGTLDGEVQGFVVRESLHKDEEKAMSPPSSSPRGFQKNKRKELGSQWVPIGWARLSELFQGVQSDPMWWNGESDLSDDDESLTTADLAQPYWQKRAGPTFWCHVDARHPNVQQTLANSSWLHPAVSVALRDEKRLISERMKHLLYEVPVRVAGGLLFELTGHSIGDPNHDEEDIAVILRSWQSQNFLITSMHVKGIINHLNVLGVMEVQDLVGAGGQEAPKTSQEVVAQLASRLARWDDRMSRKHFFGAADEVELKYVNRKSDEDLTLLSIILNREIRFLATQVIGIKWSLHARQEIIHELQTHFKEEKALKILDKVDKQTREMLEEQDDVRDRLFTVQDVMQSNAREKLQQKSLRIQHNLSVIGGGGLLLSVIVGLFGINLDGIPGGEDNPYAFAIFSICLSLLGAIVIVAGIQRLGLKNPPTEEEVTSRKAELQEFVQQFQQASEAHEKIQHVTTDSDTTSTEGFFEDENTPQQGTLDGSNDYYVRMN